MDIPTLSMNLSHQHTSNNVGVALMKMAKEQLEQQGSDMTKLLGSMAVSVMPHPDSTIDISL